MKNHDLCLLKSCSVIFQKLILSLKSRCCAHPWAGVVPGFLAWRLEVRKHQETKTIAYAYWNLSLSFFLKKSKVRKSSVCEIFYTLKKNRLHGEIALCGFTKTMFLRRFCFAKATCGHLNCVFIWFRQLFSARSAETLKNKCMSMVLLVFPYDFG